MWRRNFVEKKKGTKKRIEFGGEKFFGRETWAITVANNKKQGVVRLKVTFATSGNCDGRTAKAVTIG